jgi:hypothetical protein
MRMIADPESNRRYGLSGPQALGVFIACALFMLAMLSILPES